MDICFLPIPASTSARHVRIFWLSGRTQQNITQKRENGKICKRAASKNFPMQWISKRHTTPILLLTRAVQIWFWVQSSSFRNRLVFSVCFPITRGNLFLHLSLVNNGERAKLLIAIHTLRFLTFALSSSSSLSSPVPFLSCLLPSPVPYLSSILSAPPKSPSPSGLYDTYLYCQMQL